MLKRILERQHGVVRNGLICLRIGTIGGLFKHGNEYSSSMKCLKILE
jgi:hypothetical protein